MNMISVDFFVPGQFFKDWDVAKAQSPPQLYLFHFVTILRSHGFCFILELVKFFKVLRMRWPTAEIIDSFRDFFLRIGVGLVNLAAL